MALESFLHTTVCVQSTTTMLLVCSVSVSIIIIIILYECHEYNNYYCWSIANYAKLIAYITKVIIDIQF